MRIGVLTGGGDCPGLNAVIRSIIRKGEGDYGHAFVGYKYGWKGVLEGNSVELGIESTRGLLHKGGTILGTSRMSPSMVDNGADKVRATMEADNVDVLITIGGNGTLSGAASMSAQESILWVFPRQSITIFPPRMSLLVFIQQYKLQPMRWTDSTLRLKVMIVSWSSKLWGAIPAGLQHIAE